MLERTATSLGTLLDAVREIARTWTPSRREAEEIWFRGQGTPKHQLVPTLYRKDVQRLHYDEESLFERFKALGAPFLERLPRDEWDWYFLARHHGLPSRLLDWSESVLVAANFALAEHILSGNRLRLDDELIRPKATPVFDDESPTIWMLDAGTLNQFSRGEDRVFSPGGALTLEYLPEGLLQSTSTRNEWPLAILPARFNSRIAAQQGMFTIHGRATGALDDIVGGSSAAAATLRLAAIKLDRANLSHLWDDLQISGVGRVGIMPGLDSVAAHVAWINQSETEST